MSKSVGLVRAGDRVRLHCGGVGVVNWTQTMISLDPPKGESPMWTAVGVALDGGDGETQITTRDISGVL